MFSNRLPYLDDMFTRNFRLSRHVRFPLVLGLAAHDGVQSFIVTPRLSFKSRRSPLAHPRPAGANLRMTVEPVLTLLLSAESTLSLRCGDGLGWFNEVGRRTSIIVRRLDAPGTWVKAWKLIVSCDTLPQGFLSPIRITDDCAYGPASVYKSDHFLLSYGLSS